jgi:hypothetical protein
MSSKKTELTLGSVLHPAAEPGAPPLNRGVIVSFNKKTETFCKITQRCINDYQRTGSGTAF